MTELTITPKIAKKCASIVGRIAAGEHVALTVVGAASLKTPTLQMRVIAGPTVIAMFPAPVEDGQTPSEWTVSGSDLVCELNLNTVQALALCRAPETFCLFSFEEVGDKDASPSERCPQLYFVAPHPVLCWPKRRPSDTPFDFDDYPSTFKTWQWQISNIAASVTKNGRTATILIVDKNGVQTVATVSDGVGVPAGGARGQVLVKKSAADFDTEWKDGGGGGGGGSVDWNDVENKPTAFPPEAHSQGWSTITDKPSSFTPTSHASTHAANGSDPITPASIGALSSTVGGVSGYVMSLGGVQYIMQTAYTLSGVAGWGTADGEWKLFVDASGSVMLMKDGVPKPTNPNTVSGLAFPWSLQLLDGSGTAVVSDAGSTSTDEIIGHLRSRENPHGVTAEQIGAAAAGDIPTALSQLSGDAENRTVTDVEKTAWNGKQNALTFEVIAKPRSFRSRGTRDPTKMRIPIGTRVPRVRWERVLQLPRSTMRRRAGARTP